MAKAPLAGIGVVLAVVPSVATPVVAARPTRPLAHCMAIDEPAARLTCYDAALGRPEPPRGTGAPPRMPPAAPPIAAASPPLAISSPRVAAPRAAPAPGVIDGRIVAVAAIGNDLFRFQLADGSIWHTGEQASAPPRAGEMVHIRRSVLAYYAAIGGRASIGIRPVR